MSDIDRSRRDFIRKAAYTAPVVLTLTALPAYASTGSNRPSNGNNGNGNGNSGNNGNHYGHDRGNGPWWRRLFGFH